MSREIIGIRDAFVQASHIHALPPSVGEAAPEWFAGDETVAQLLGFCQGQNLDVHANCEMYSPSSVGGVALFEADRGDDIIALPIPQYFNLHRNELIFFKSHTNVGYITAAGASCMPLPIIESTWHQIAVDW